MDVREDHGIRYLRLVMRFPEDVHLQPRWRYIIRRNARAVTCVRIIMHVPVVYEMRNIIG